MVGGCRAQVRVSVRDKTWNVRVQVRTLCATAAVLGQDGIRKGGGGGMLCVNAHLRFVWCVCGCAR